jgi:HEPN domain-containing protein
MSDDDRTTPLGLFNYARSYWQSGVQLHKSKPNISHPDAPVTLLLAHAIELYLKAFLRLRGLSVGEVKSDFGHNFRKLIREASDRGLPIDEEDEDVASMLTEQETIRTSRYIETGYYQRPGLAALSRTCKSLDEAVLAALRDSGVSARSIKLDHIEAH